MSATPDFFISIVIQGKRKSWEWYTRFFEWFKRSIFLFLVKKIAPWTGITSIVLEIEKNFFVHKKMNFTYYVVCERLSLLSFLYRSFWNLFLEGLFFLDLNGLYFYSKREIGRFKSCLNWKRRFTSPQGRLWGILLNVIKDVFISFRKSILKSLGNFFPLWVRYYSLRNFKFYPQP